MSSVVYPSTFQSKSITISAPRTLQSGAKQAYLNYGGERLVMQTAVAMSSPFGLNSFQSQNGVEYSVDLSFRGSDNRPELQEFKRVLEQMDELMINEGVKNSKAWFKADLNKEVIKAFYTPSLKYSKDKEGNVLSYPPNIKVKLPKRNGEWDTKFYDLNGSPYKGVPVEDLIVKGTQITAIIECGGVWFAGSKFGLTWRAKQIAIHKLPEKMGEFAFKGLASAPVAMAEDADDEQEVDDEAVFKSASAASSKPSAVAAMMPQAMQQDDEVDDEDGDDIEPVPVPRKTVIKKKVVPAKK
uniref:Uncharacterized protein n=1 Tax=viral metagenome TaxID=1070528 RepID=A0A6C0KV42_9ZZZZ